MRFSYNVIKKMVKDADPQARVIGVLTMHTAPVENPGGATFDLELPSNRYADLASHLGVAREYVAAGGKTLIEPKLGKLPSAGKRKVVVKIQNEAECPRYMACLFDLGKKRATPTWLKATLEDCGVRSINPVVDILNYVMLEVGQPMHAFDADKLKGGITVRRARAGEEIETIDRQKFLLGVGDLVIADDAAVQAIAGIKGGKMAEVTSETKRILVESANFDQVRVYNTSKRLRLVTDAAVRFGHGQSPYGAELGMRRAIALLEEITGARAISCTDAYPKKANEKIIGFNVARFNSLVGTNLGQTQIRKYLAALGFQKISKKTKGKDDFLVVVPPLRLDIEIFEDLAEEVIRLHGINELSLVAPSVSLVPAAEADIIVFKDKVRNMLVAVGFSETYTTSFVGDGGKSAYELENPIAVHKTHLRQNLVKNLKEQATENAKHFDTVKVFELGSVFNKDFGERVDLGLVARGKTKDIFLEVRGVIEQLLNGLGFVDHTLYPQDDKLVVEVEGEEVGEIWHLGKDSAAAELNASRLMELEEGDFEYKPIPKYPAIMRDLSLSFRENVPVGIILAAIEEAKAEHVQNVDLIDYYDPQHLTFRIVFQSEERTLKDAEVTEELAKIVTFLKRKFPVEVR